MTIKYRELTPAQRARVANLIGAMTTVELARELRARRQAKRAARPALCALCGAPAPVDQSCICFDNNCQ